MERAADGTDDSPQVRFQRTRCRCHRCWGECPQRAGRPGACRTGPDMHHHRVDLSQQLWRQQLLHDLFGRMSTISRYGQQLVLFHDVVPVTTPCVLGTPVRPGFPAHLRVRDQDQPVLHVHCRRLALGRGGQRRRLRVRQRQAVLLQRRLLPGGVPLPGSVAPVDLPDGPMRLTGTTSADPDSRMQTVDVGPERGWLPTCCR